jgi:iron complex transport system substrate-binding protein
VIIASFSAPELRALISARGVQVLEFDNFSGFADYRRHVRAVATAVDARPAAEALLATMDRRLAALAARRPADPPTAISWGDGFAATGATTFADIAAAIGLVNLPEQQGLSGHVPVAIEQLVAWDPAVIVITCPAAAARRPRLPRRRGRLRRRPRPRRHPRRPHRRHHRHPRPRPRQHRRGHADRR